VFAPGSFSPHSCQLFNRHTNVHGFVLYLPAGLGMCSLFTHCRYIYLSGFPVSVGGNIMDHYFKCSLVKNVDKVNHHFVVVCGHLLYCMSTWTLPQCFSFVFCHAHGSLFVWNCDVGTWHYVHVVDLRAKYPANLCFNFKCCRTISLNCKADCQCATFACSCNVGRD
jgi:hypothetical protein